MRADAEPAAGKYVAFSQNIIIIGFGSIGQAILPLLFRHLVLPRGAAQIQIITKDTSGAHIAQSYGVSLQRVALTRENYRQILVPYLQAGNLLLNLSVEVSSIDLVQLCQQHDVLYLDTCIEPWAGGYTDPTVPAYQRTNYALRETALAIKQQGRPSTAILAHGANPGLVSHFTKQALLNIAVALGERPLFYPSSRRVWAELAQQLGIKVIHIAECDTQMSGQSKQKDEFVNTWSIDGFVAEGLQPAELGWGSHEQHWPTDACSHDYGCQSAIYLRRPGAATRVRTWTPLAGAINGFLITHNEAVSIADYFTLKEDNKLIYRPTVHYAYHPCDDAVLSLHELAGREWQPQSRQRLLVDEIVSGTDELGVLLMGHARNIYWYGSQLTIEEARQLAPHNNATSLQVVAGVMAAVVWAILNPRAGVLEADEIDHRFILEIAAPYLGKLTGHYSEWNPLKDRGRLFPETIDHSDPWQFINLRVN